MAFEGEKGRPGKPGEKQLVVLDGWMGVWSQERMFVEEGRMNVKLLREGIALHRNSIFLK